MSAANALDDLFDQVRDARSFLAYARALQQDCAAYDRFLSEHASDTEPPVTSWENEWQNGTIETFLDCAIAGFEDNKFADDPQIDVNPWQFFARFLALGKHYD